MKRSIALSALATSALALAGASSANAAPATSYPYVHAASSAGYGSEAECQGYLNKFATIVGSYNPLTNAEHPGGGYSPVGCWQQSDGKWTYGSFAFSLPKTISDADKAALGGYVAAPKSVANVRIHNSARYSSIADCIKYSKSATDAIIKGGGKVLQAPVCNQVIASLNGAGNTWDLAWSYDHISYSTPTGKAIVTPADYMASTPYLSAIEQPVYAEDWVEAYSNSDYLAGARI